MKSNACVRGHLGKWPPCWIFDLPSDTIYLITIEMLHAICGACTSIYTIHHENANCLLDCKSVTTCPNANVTTCPNVISITKLVIVEKYGVPTSSDLYHHEQVNIHTKSYILNY